jgi:hypothetical protein
MGSGAMIYIPGSMKIGSGIQKLMERGDTRQHGGGISLVSLFQNKVNMLKHLVR